MKSYHSLTVSEERDLFLRIKESHDKQACDRIILAYRPLVKKVVFANRSRFRITSAEDIEDCIQEGVFGLYRALEKYDPDKGSFATYAWHWVLYYLRAKRLKDEVLAGRTDQLSAKRNAIMRERAVLQRKLNREPTHEELVGRTGFTPNLVRREVAHLLSSYASLDAPIGEGDAVVGDLIPDASYLSPEDHVIARETLYEAEKYISGLVQRVRTFQSERNSDVFLRRHALPPYREVHSLDAIAHIHSITRERVRQISVTIWQRLGKGAPRFTEKGLAAAQHTLLMLPEAIDA